MNVQRTFDQALADVVRQAIEIASPVKAPAVRSTFAQLARQAFLAAQADGIALNDMERLAAQTGSDAISDMLDRAKTGTARMGEIYALLMLLVPHEREIRALIMAPADQPDMTLPPAPKPPAPKPTA